MEATKTKFETVAAYIATFPKEVQSVLESLRKTIKKAAPEAEEVISYNMPAYKLHGNLVYFAAWKSHVGFYPGASGIEKFKEALSGYAGAKGSVQFPFNEPMPLGLIAEIVAFRKQQNLDKKRIIKTKNK